MIVKSPVYLYRFIISPLIGPRCRYNPTCSEYALQALETHGVTKGLALMLSRIFRCHPWSGCEYHDPVPTRFTWRGCFGYKRRHCSQNHDHKRETSR